MTEFSIELGRLSTESYYDIQELRIGTYNRLRDIVRRKNEGIPMGKPEEKKEVKSYDKMYSDKELPGLLERMFRENKLTSDEHRQVEKLLKILHMAELVENNYKPLMRAYLQSEELWYDWMEKIKGIGEVIGANLLSKIGYCETFDTVSALWKYCGLDVTGDGIAPKRTKGQKITWNPKMRTLAWKISDMFIKMNTPTYRQLYDNEKAKQLAREYPKGELAKKFNGYKDDSTNLSKGHADMRARRKVVKVFLQHYWVIARQLKGLETKPPYVHGVLQHKEYIPPPHIPSRLEPFKAY